VLIARPRSLFSRSYSIQDQGGQALAELEISLLKEGAILRHAGKTYRIERESYLSGPWYLKDGHDIVFEAHKPSMMRNRFTTMVKNASLELSPTNILMRRFILVGPDWADLGQIRRVSLWSRRAEVELSDLVPVLAQLFFLFQAIVLWNRADSAAAS
jgi:hypothetical protein